MNMITFKGKEYPVRSFIVKHDGKINLYNISVQSLSDAMGEDKEEFETEANDIDSTIYFYVEDEDINLDAEEICKNHLDEPMKFLEEDLTLKVW